MKERRLGKTGLKVSEIGFGCWAIGGGSYGPVQDEDSLDALEAAWESGVTFFDTADVYGEGHSEELLGRFLKYKTRDQVIVATKGGLDFSKGAYTKNFSPGYLRTACENSLKRLRTDRIDLYQLHNPSRDLMQKKEMLDVLTELKKEGKIRAIGISVHTEIDAFTALQDPRVGAIQIIFNFLDQRMNEKILPEADKKNIGVIAREPLASGLLSGKYPPAHQFPKNDHRARWVAEKRALDWQKVQYLQTALKGKQISLVQAALEYALKTDGVSVIIPGAKTRAQVLENVKASLEPVLDQDDRAALETLYSTEEVFQKGLIPR